MSCLPDLVLFNIFHFLNHLDLLNARKVCSLFDSISSDFLFKHMNEWNAILFILRKSQYTSIENPQFNVCVRSSFDNWILTLTKKAIFFNSINHPDLCLHLISIDEDWNIQEKHLYYDQFIVLEDFRILLKIKTLGTGNQNYVFELNFQDDNFFCTCHLVDLSKDWNWITSILSLITKTEINFDDRYSSDLSVGQHFLKKTHNSIVDRSIIIKENNQLICCERDILTGEIITQFPLNEDISDRLITCFSSGLSSRLIFHKFERPVYSTSFKHIVVWFSNNKTFLIEHRITKLIFIISVIEKNYDFYFLLKIGQGLFKIYCLTSGGLIFESHEIQISESFQKLSLINSNLLFVSETKSEHIVFQFIKNFKCNNNVCEIGQYLVIKFIQ